jgi:Fe-S cluster biogenesis protein NfuA
MQQLQSVGGSVAGNVSDGLPQLTKVKRRRLANDGGFGEQVRQLGERATQLEQLPEGPAKSAGKELVQLLMDVHGAAIERMLDVVFESAGDKAQGTIDKMGQDPRVASLLLLYGLHPDDLQTRVEKAVEAMRPRLRKLSHSVELMGVVDGRAQVRLTSTGHSCGSSSKDLRAVVEDGMYEFAPDVTAVEVLGLDEPSAPGFVALESLMGHRLAAAASNGRGLERDGGD